MARPTPFVKPVQDAPPPRRFFTPLNVLLLILALGGAATAAVIQFAADAPKPRIEVAPASTAEAASPTVPATPPPPARTGISQPPGGLSTALAGPITTTIQPEGITHGSALDLFKTTPPTLGLDPPLPGTAIPINKIDLFTDKGIGPAAVYKSYKGYSIGFCCNKSGGYISGWDSMNEAEKDTFVRSFIPK